MRYTICFWSITKIPGKTWKPSDKEQGNRATKSGAKVCATHAVKQEQVTGVRLLVMKGEDAQCNTTWGLC